MEEELSDDGTEECRGRQRRAAVPRHDVVGAQADSGEHSSDLCIDLVGHHTEVLRLLGVEALLVRLATTIERLVRARATFGHLAIRDAAAGEVSSKISNRPRQTLDLAVAVEA